MNKKCARAPLLSGILLFLFAVGISLAASPLSALLTVSFINVGQGECILIQSPNGHAMLIDAGPLAAGPKITYYLKSRYISKIDALIVTAPRNNHVGGLATIIYTFPVDRVYLPNISGESALYQETLKSLKNRRLTTLAAKAGALIHLDPALVIEVLAPLKNHYSFRGDYSTVIKISYGKNSFLFMGDAGEVSEKEMLKANDNLRADVLKVGRHGSLEATTEKFLQAVAPKHAVISVGVNNRYGYPDEDTLEKLEEAGADIYRTDINGTVKVTSDGKKISVTADRANVGLGGPVGRK